MSGRRILAVLWAMTCLPVVAAPEKLDDALRRCAKDGDERQRLACFDAVVSSLPQVEADRFGMTADIEHRRDPAAASPKADVLKGKISALRQGTQGEFIFTLDNGQAWVEADVHRNVPFAVGDDVEIEHGAMSALWLIADQHRKVRVRRLH
jgi:hypothetical protein